MKKNYFLRLQFHEKKGYRHRLPPISLLSGLVGGSPFPMHASVCADIVLVKVFDKNAALWLKVRDV